MDILVFTQPSNAAHQQQHYIVISVPESGIQKITTPLEYKIMHKTSSLPHTHPILFAAFEGTNLRSDILKLHLGAFFLKIISKSHRNSDILV